MPTPKLNMNQMKLLAEEFKSKFTPGFYHGSPNPNITSFDPMKSTVRDTDFVTPGVTFATRSPNFADSFTNGKGPYISMKTGDAVPAQNYTKGATMYPVSIDMSNHFDPMTPEGFEVVRDYVAKKYADDPKMASTFKSRIQDPHSNWSTMESPSFLQHLRDTGHTSFAVNESGYQNVGILDPSKIRGKFAKYNPEDAASPDFMKAEGGAVEHYQVGGKVLSSGLESLLNMIKAEGRTPVVPVPNRWFAQPEKFPHVQGMVNKTLENSQLPREAFHSGAFIDPRTGQILDRNIYNDVGVLIDPNTGRPMMSAGAQSGLDILDPKTGSYTKSNLVRQSLFKPTGGDPMLGEMPFIATIEKGGMGHKYALGTEYATPTEMYNTMTGANPTLRPRSRGDVFGMGDVVGQVQVGGRGEPHDVYEKLFVAPKGSDVPGVKLSKKTGGKVKKK